MKALDKPHILFDHRDKDDDGHHEWAEQTKLEVLADIEVGHLKLGDISWLGAGGRPHLAEIKHARDLALSLRTEHLQDQMTRMLAWNETQHEGTAGLYLLIAGKIGCDNNGYITYSNSDWPIYDFKGLNLEAVTGIDEWELEFRPYNMYLAYMASLQASGVTVLSFAPNLFGKSFGALWRWTTKKAHNRKVRRTTVLPPEQQALLALSPSLNQTASKLLLEEFGTMRDVMFQEIDTLVQVNGVGPVTAKEIIENGTRTHD